MQRTPLPKKILIIFDFLFYFLNYLVLTVLIVLLFCFAKNNTILVHLSVLRPLGFQGAAIIRPSLSIHAVLRPLLGCLFFAFIPPSCWLLYPATLHCLAAAPFCPSICLSVCLTSHNIGVPFRTLLQRGGRVRMLD